MFRPRKSLGQNFLRDENILRKITEAFHPQEGDTVLEIGPGQGALTRHLLQSPADIIAVEIDDRAIAVLREEFGEKLTLLHQDVLQVSLQEFALRAGKPLRIIGNIPYYITSDILFFLFENHLHVQDALVMMQWEVARRLTATPRSKEYGILSVYTNLYTQCKILFKVSRNVFFPRPDVDSAMVHFSFRPTLPDFDDHLFKSVVRSTFGKRRKTLRNGLKDLALSSEQLDAVAFDLSKRPEELSVSDFLSLTILLTPLLKKESLTV